MVCPSRFAGLKSVHALSHVENDCAEAVCLYHYGDEEESKLSHRPIQRFGNFL